MSHHFAMKACKLLCQGCIGYWSYAIDTQEKEDRIEDIDVACEFREFFLKSY